MSWQQFNHCNSIRILACTGSWLPACWIDVKMCECFFSSTVSVYCSAFLSKLTSPLHISMIAPYKLQEFDSNSGQMWVGIRYYNHERWKHDRTGSIENSCWSWYECRNAFLFIKFLFWIRLRQLNVSLPSFQRLCYKNWTVKTQRLVRAHSRYFLFHHIFIYIILTFYCAVWQTLLYWTYLSISKISSSQ